MKIFITGVNSFIGQALAKKLVDIGHEVHGLIHSNNSLKVEGIIFHQSSLIDYEKIGSILESVNPNYIIHLAARTEVEGSFYNPMSFSEVNYLGTVNLIEKCRELLSLKLFIFASTMETYGYQIEPDWRPFDEQTTQNPNAPYAVAKVGCEHYLRYASRAYNIPYTILRQTNTYGRWDNDFFVVEQFITQMLKNNKEVQFGDPKPYRNFLYIDDLIDLYLNIIENPKPAKNEIFCTGPDNVVQIKELADVIAGLLNWKGKIKWNKNQIHMKDKSNCFLPHSR